MSEELRFFLRIAGYAGLVAAIYWFVSYEAAGTVLLAGLAVAAVAFLLVVRSSVPASKGTGKESGLVDRLRASVGFREAAGRAEQPLEIEEDLFPTASIWPLVLTLGITLAALGLQYGAWLWGPGAAIAAGAGIAWLIQLR